MSRGGLEHEGGTEDPYLGVFIDFCLEKSYLWFDNAFYNESTGTAKGVNFVLSFVNLYVENWKINHLFRK